MEPCLEFQDVAKSFPGVQALRGINFAVRGGTVHGLVGQNGAGKSTLLKILGGVFRPDAGRILINGKQESLACTRNARAAGIAVIHQELNLVPEMTVAENLLLGRWPRKGLFLDKREMLRRAKEQIAALGEEMDPGQPAGALPMARRQMIEIGKALLHEAGIVALDEPTSSLSRREAGRLLEIVNTLKGQGKTVLYVSHRMEEIFTLCDAVSVFRDGRLVETFTDMGRVTHDLLVRRMVGREIKRGFGDRARRSGETLLEVKGLLGPGLKEAISFCASRGEILGIFGLGGAGRTVLLKLMVGACRPQAGMVAVNGRPVRLDSPASTIREGICLCPEDRKNEGILPGRSVGENINISCRRRYLKAGLFLDKGRERENALQHISLLDIRTPSAEEPAGNLSGGNQQKTILARWLSGDAGVFLLDEPTRGIDVGARQEIYRIMHRLADEGKAVVFASSDIAEVLGVADRILVLCEGRFVGEVDPGGTSEEKLLSLALPPG